MKRNLLLLLVLCLAAQSFPDAKAADVSWIISPLEWQATLSAALGTTERTSPVVKSLLYMYGMQLEKKSLAILEKHDKAIQSALDWGEKPPGLIGREMDEMRSAAVRGNLLRWYALALDNPQSSVRAHWETARQKNLQVRQKLIQRYGAEEIRQSWQHLTDAVVTFKLPQASFEGE